MRRAVTLVELLVVVALIAMLVGMLVPSVQSARETARRSACGNHLRQLALAQLHHEQVRRRLPPGYRFSFAPAGNTAGFAWGMLALPFTDEEAVYAEFRLERPIHDPVNQPPRDLDDPADDHGHMVLFQTGHPPNHADSDDRDVSSAHSGLAQFAMCDGAVRAIEDTIDLTVYTALGTRSGGETIRR